MSRHRKLTHKPTRTRRVVKKRPSQPKRLKNVRSSSYLFAFMDSLVALPEFSRQFVDWMSHSFSRSKRVGILFLLLGILLISFPYVTNFFINLNTQESEIPIKADSTFASSLEEKNLPQRIIIPSLAIDLSVTPSKLVKGYWQTSETTASFGLGSAVPGQVGNTVVFAHAKEGLFLPLKNITFGKDIYVFTKDTWYQYRVDEIREVLPSDVYVVKKTSDNRLTLFTCTGFLDSKRLVVIAKPLQ